MAGENLFAKYRKEREGLDLLEDENAFIFYKISGRECFLADMYIDPAARRAGLFKKLIDQLAAIATDCDVITANIWLTDKNANRTLRASLAIGFKVEQANNGVLLLVKDLKELK